MSPPDPGHPGAGSARSQELDAVLCLPEAAWLEDGRLVLEPLRVAHAEVMVGVLSDPVLYKHMGGSPPTREQLSSRYERQAAGRPIGSGEQWFNWVVKERSSGEAVGYVQATARHARKGPVAELAWVVGAPYQGRGLAKGAARMMRQWLCQQGVHSFTAHIHPDNLASAAVATHLGLSPNGLVEGGEAVWAGTCNGGPYSEQYHYRCAAVAD
jgi:RimJ/RimL family protein N-acetyltransferase